MSIQWIEWTSQEAPDRNRNSPTLTNRAWGTLKFKIRTWGTRRCQICVPEGFCVI